MKHVHLFAIFRSRTRRTGHRWKLGLPPQYLLTIPQLSVYLRVYCKRCDNVGVIDVSNFPVFLDDVAHMSRWDPCKTVRRRAFLGDVLEQ